MIDFLLDEKPKSKATPKGCFALWLWIVDRCDR
jgi:hypothetical protein